MAQIVSLPAKWYIIGTGAPDTVSDVFDEQNRKRGRILHKAAEAGTTHELVLDARYGVRQSLDNTITESTIYFGEENGTSLFTAGKLKLPEYTVVKGAIKFVPGPNLESYRERHDALINSARDWGLSHYPDFSNPNAYWDAKR
jgi:hypothetical protein